MKTAMIDANIGPQTKSEKAKQGLAADFNNFVKLLTVQLKNQDPTAPMDGNEFTQQMVMFTGVEQAVNTNTNLEKLIKLHSGAQLNNYTGYIGKDVGVDFSQAFLSNNKATFKYNLGQDTVGAEAIIYDANDRAVYSEALNGPYTAPGKHEYVWDGMTDKGEKLKNGNYSIKINSWDKDGLPTENDNTLFGHVSGITLKNGIANLIVDNVEIEADRVISVLDINKK